MDSKKGQEIDFPWVTHRMNMGPGVTQIERCVWETARGGDKKAKRERETRRRWTSGAGHR